eukprot:TRINITY_DN112923_c0_g1_i1.p1 TRINITY_DN112923_c0_g1~~TRINITY_DN112923_c0_g1_i1.p1  ORF type:complete len:215 (-),score=27.15 TRINITY_DN112923_c0_g1_i1:16-660(-)
MAPKSAVVKATAGKAASKAASKASAKASSKAASSAPSLPAAPPPREWPPKVPLGPIPDILPMIEADDDDIDTLMLSMGEGATDRYGPDEIGYICGCLAKNTQIRHLNVSCCAVGDAGAAHIAKVLEGGSTPIARLSLNSCGLGSLGAMAVIEALAANKHVQVLELSCNEGVDDEAGQAIVEMLKQNKSVKQITMAMCPLSDDLRTKIDKQLMIR